jgi:hypothetical protein
MNAVILFRSLRNASTSVASQRIDICRSQSSAMISELIATYCANISCRLAITSNNLGSGNSTSILSLIPVYYRCKLYCGRLLNHQHLVLHTLRELCHLGALAQNQVHRHWSGTLREELDSLLRQLVSCPCHSEGSNSPFQPLGITSFFPPLEYVFPDHRIYCESHSRF